jgi:SRSO17 transposase
MAERTMAAGVPFAWVAADTVYGVSELEMALRRAGKGYVLGMPSTQAVWSSGARPDVAGTAEDVAAALPSAAWQRRSAGAGTKGPRVYDWAYVELADLDAQAQGYSGSHGLWTRGLLIRRSITDSACAFFATWCPTGTGIDTLVAVEGSRWTIEDSFETAKTEFGLDHNESRSWHGWHRHVSLVMLAFAMLATIRYHANHPAPQKTLRRLPPRGPSPRPLVTAGNPPRRHPLGTAPHPPGPCHRLVTLAQSAPSRGSTLTSETKYATVMVGPVSG